MNFDTLGVHLGTFRVAQKCQKGLKVPLFSQKCLGRIFGLLFEKIGLLFDQTVWSHWEPRRRVSSNEKMKKFFFSKIVQ